MKYEYKKGIIRFNCGCWFVFTKQGLKVGVFLSEKEAKEFCDNWEKIYA